MAKVVVVGLGPAGADLVVPAGRAALARIHTRFVRTARHPAIEELAASGLAFTAFDDVYETGADPESVYMSIVDELVAAARSAPGGEVAYAVPGSPVVAERTVVLLGERARAGTIDLEVVPGLSFAELAWARLGVDPLGGARVVDGRAIVAASGELEAGGPLLVAQVDTTLVLSDVKLALLDRLDPDHPVTLLHHLGRPEERIQVVPVADADRVLEPDHLTALFVELPAGPADAFGALLALGRRLRGPGGCPWDAEQTHHSLTRYLLEESYEVVDAIEALPADAPGGDNPVDPRAWAALADELGDLLFQVVFHAVLAEEAGAFTAADVSVGITEKLVRRHPHVFGDVSAETPSDVMRNWEQIKKDERGSDSIVDTVAPGLPALLYTHKLFRKAASVGLDPSARSDAVASADAALMRLRADDTANEAAVGELLGAAVALARAGGVDAESALRGWAARYRAQFQRMESLARDRGVDLHALDRSAADALWAEARQARGERTRVTGENVRRLSAGIGLAAVVVTFVGWLLVPGDPPGPEALPEQVVRWTLDDRRSLLVGSVLIAAGLALAVAFFAGLRALCARAEGAPGILATIGWGSMLVGLAVVTVGIALVQTQSFLVLDGDPATVQAFHEARLLLVNMAGLPIAFGFAAFGAAMVRTGFPARWLGWAAAVAAVAQLLGVVALSHSGFFSPAGGAAVVGALAFGLWVAAASLTLFVQKSGP